MTSPEKDTSELLQLCGKVRDGEITSAEFTRLETWLLEDPQALDTYRRFMAMCSGLEQTAIIERSAAERRQVAAEVDTAAEIKLAPKRSPKGVSKRSPKGFSNGSRSKPKPPPRRVKHREISIVVAALSTIAAVIVFAVIRFDNNGGNTNSFATVASVHQPVWNGDQALLPDESVEAGEYSLVSGAVLVKYASGAELLVQAPASFSLHDEQRTTLSSGAMSLYIPPEATGFRIDTPFGSAIDHGTRIGVVADAETGMELHVFEGKAQLVAPGATTGAMLAANEAANIAANIAAESPTVTSIDADQSYFAQSLNDLKNLPAVSGNVELRISPPRSVRRVLAELVDPGRATVFAERQGVKIPKDLPVTLSSPGRATKVSANDAMLTAGQRVDSFLVHFVLPRDRWRADEVMTASGQITFTRPIAGVVAYSPARLNDDFGHPSTDYPGDKLTGLEDAIDDDTTQADQIELSQDQRTLTFRLQIHGRRHAEQVDRVDQLRILVQADDGGGK